MTKKPECFDVIVIGGGQAGLSVGYHLKQLGARFLMLDASKRVGDVWRRRWDSLRLFTCARFSSLDGMRFPAPPDYFPTKDEMADYLEAYAARFELPLLSGVRVDRLSKRGDVYEVRAGERCFLARRVIVAMGNHQRSKAPGFARDLGKSITQLHSTDYKRPRQLQPGPVLLVGAGNSGSEIAMELVKSHQVYMSGRSTGALPFRIEGLLGRLLLVHLVLRVVFHRILSLYTPIGRRVRPKFLHRGGPLVRVKPRDMRQAGVKRVARTVGTKDGRPLLEDGRALDVTNVVWCTGFHACFDWIDLSIFDEHGLPRHEAGIVPDAPGLYFVGLHFLYSLSSEMIHGVGRDAKRIARRATQDLATAGSHLAGTLVEGAANLPDFDSPSQSQSTVAKLGRVASS